MAITSDVEIDRESPVAGVLLAYVREQVQGLMAQDLQVRQTVPDSVHQMRVSIRRLRSVLATYRTLLDVDIVGHLREELKWLGLILGAERDAEVMRQRLIEVIASEPNKMDFELITHYVDEQLTADLSAAQQIVFATLNGERYLRLLNDLDIFLAGPPLTSLANESAKRIVPNLIREDCDRLRRAVRDSKGNSVDHEFALHEVRKNAKRLRYAAETAELVPYKRASKLADAAEWIQRILGDYHDSIAVRDLLRRVGEQVTAKESNDFGFEHLIALEERNAEKSEIQFRKAWRRFPSSSL